MDVEGMAGRMLEAVEMTAPVHPWVMAARAGYRVRMGPGSLPAMTLGPTIVVPEHREERRAFAVLHELAHAALRNSGHDDPEGLVDAIASAVLLPREPFARDVEETRGDLDALKARHPFASYEAIGRRIVALRGGSLLVHDIGPRGKRVRQSGTLPHRTLARALVLEAHASGRPLGPPEMRAVPVRDGAWSRVLLLSL